MEAQNNIKAKVLKTISGTKWTGTTTHDTLDKCLTAINLDTFNSGWYTPKAIRVNGLTGIYMINEDGSLFVEARVIKQDDKKYLIEYLTNEGYNEFEQKFTELI